MLRCGLICDLNTASGVALCFRFEVGGTIKENSRCDSVYTVAYKRFRNPLNTHKYHSKVNILVTNTNKNTIT